MSLSFHGSCWDQSYFRQNMKRALMNSSHLIDQCFTELRVIGICFYCFRQSDVVTDYIEKCAYNMTWACRVFSGYWRLGADFFWSPLEQSCEVHLTSLADNFCPLWTNLLTFHHVALNQAQRQSSQTGSSSCPSLSTGFGWVVMKHKIESLTVLYMTSKETS